MTSADLSTVYSYGGGEAIYYIFNAIAMLFNNGFARAIVDLSTAFGLIFAGLKSGIQRDSHRPYLRWALTCLFIMLVIVPRSGGMTIYIRDVVTKNAKKVDNLPPGLVIPAALISGIGYSVTKSFETVFSLADSNYLPYHQYGTMFGAQVISEFKNFKIQDPVLRENMESYISNCLMYDVMIGKSYDITELKNSKDIIALITDNASSLRMFNYRLKTKGRELKTCKAGITEIIASFEDEPTLLTKKFPFLSSAAGAAIITPGAQNSNKSKSTAVSENIVKALELSLKSYSSTPDAQAELKQILIINAFKDKPSSYGVIRAAQNQNTVWQMTGEMAKQNLPIMHALFQALIYGSFPIVMCLLFFPGGWASIGAYFGMMIWIELWAPLFAILNLIVSVFAKSSRVEDITIQSMNQIVSSQSSYAFAAASLGMLIPVLSYMIIRGGAGQFVHIASQLSGATMSGVATAAQEVTSGNRSFDNVSLGNASMNNVSSNKYDSSGFIQTAMMRQHLSSGAIQTDLADGARILHGGPGITSSDGSTQIGESTAFNRILSKQAQHSRSLAESESKELAIMEQNLERNTVDYLARIAANKSKGEHYNIDIMTDEGKRLNAIMDNTKTLHDNYNYNWQQAAEVALKGNIGVGGEVGKSGGRGRRGAKVSAEINVSSSGRLEQADAQSLGEGHIVSSNKQTSENVDLIARASKNVNYSENQSEEKSLSSSLNSTYEKMHSQRESISRHQTDEKRALSMMDESSSTSFNVHQNKYDEILNYIAKQPDASGIGNVGMTRAYQIIENGDTSFAKYLEAFDPKAAKHKEELKEMDDFHAMMKKMPAVNFNEKSLSQEWEVKNTTEQFKERFIKEEFSNFDVNGDKIKQEVADKEASANMRIDEQAKKNDAAGSQIKKEVDKAEGNKNLLIKIARFIGIELDRENKNKGKDWKN